MGELIGVAVGALVVILICRSIAGAFPVIKRVVMLIPFAAAITVGVTSGIGYGIATFIGSAIVLGIMFGTDTEANDFRHSTHRPKKGITCKNCGSYDTYKISDSEKSELYDLQYNANGYNGTMSDAYRCNKCGHHMWFDRHGDIYYTHD